MEHCHCWPFMGTYLLLGMEINESCFGQSLGLKLLQHSPKQKDSFPKSITDKRLKE